MDRSSNRWSVLVRHALSLVNNSRSFSMTADELIALIHSAIKETKVDCERLTEFEQDNDEIVMRFFDLEEEEE